MDMNQRPTHLFFRGLLLLAFATMLGACANRDVRGNPNVSEGGSLPAPDSTSEAGVYEGATDYRIGAQDQLEITVFGIDDLSRTVRVNSNGQISLPLVGAVTVGGKTVPEVEQAIADKLKNGYLQDPQVTVFIKEFASQRVTLEGAVTAPGIYPLTGKTTLLQVIAMARGLDEKTADLQGVIVFRQVEGKRMGAVFDLAKVRAGTMPDPQIYGDDIIVVEQSGSKSAYRRIIESVPIVGLFGWLL
jgi:polysaccharide export outer membrane protein